MGAKATYLERYLAGEYEPVWAELQRLGAAVREEPLYGDALAVARETMRRARANIELLIPRLRAAGYDFGYGWLAAEAEWEAQQRVPLTPEDLREMQEMGVSDELLQKMAEHDGDDVAWKLDYAREHHPILSPPGPEVHEQFAALERLVGGPIPLSLYAWYEHVGVVDFIGTAPAAWGMVPVLLPPGSQEPYYLHRADRPEAGSGTEGSTDPYAYSFRPLPPLTAQRQEGAGEADVGAVAGSDEATPDAPADERLQGGIVHELDPLYIYPLEDVLRSIRRQSAHADAEEYYAELAPDEYFKYFVSGGGPYAIRIPDARADALLEGEWHETTFVDYLRICFRWAGLPGLEGAMLPDAPELAALTSGLLPI